MLSALDDPRTSGFGIPLAPGAARATPWGRSWSRPLLVIPGAPETGERESNVNDTVFAGGGAAQPGSSGRPVQHDPYGREVLGP